MNTYQDLPELVVRMIFKHATGDPGLVLNDWKMALPLVAVCRGWRDIIEPVLYQNAIISISGPPVANDPNNAANASDSDSAASLHLFDRGRTSSDAKEPARTYTNIKLIESNGLQQMVKKLYIWDHEPEELDDNVARSQDSFLCFLLALYPDLRDCPGAIDIMQWFQEVQQRIRHRHGVAGRCREACSAIAADIVRRLPNVRRLSIFAPTSTYFLQRVLVKMIERYDRQLAYLFVETAAYLPLTLSAPEISKLGLTFFDNASEVFPLICPDHFSLLKIRLESSELSWDIFHFDKSTNTVVFKNMATLALFSERIYGSYEEELGAALVNTLDLQFPKLENTIIAHMPVSVDVLQNLARSTRKSIVFSGPLASMVAMLDRPIRGLEYIELRWDSKFYLYEADNFVRLSNEALGRTVGIEWVNFTLRCKVPEFVLTGINWTHVT
ncbi:hypothetical protein IWW55_004189, partial [Coemansia sp. RSA 2706]